MKKRYYALLISLFNFIAFFVVVLPSEWTLYRNYIVFPALCTVVAGIIKQMREEEKTVSLRQWKVSKIRWSAWPALYAGVAVGLGMCMYSSFTNSEDLGLQMLFSGLFVISVFLLIKEIAGSFSKVNAVEFEIYNRRAVGKNRVGEILFDVDLSHAKFEMQETAIPGIHKGVLAADGHNFVISPDFVGFDALVETLQSQIDWGHRNRLAQAQRNHSLEAFETR